MPELPEVELIVRGLDRELTGRRIEGARVFWSGYLGEVGERRFGELVVGQKFEGARRRGKFIIIELSTTALLGHLRMTGSIVRLNGRACSDEAPPHTHVLLDLDDGSRLAFSDVRKFGRLLALRRSELQGRIEALRLGLEPLSRRFGSESLGSVLAGRRRCIKSVLLDQTLVAGIGNIYACEILFVAGVNPLCPAGLVSRARTEELVKAARAVLRKAIRRGGSSISDYRRLDGSGGRMQDDFKVYGREGQPCRRCSGVIERVVISGRSTFWCPQCQRATSAGSEKPRRIDDGPVCSN